MADTVSEIVTLFVAQTASSWFRMIDKNWL